MTTGGAFGATWASGLGLTGDFGHLLGLPRRSDGISEAGISFFEKNLCPRGTRPHLLDMIGKSSQYFVKLFVLVTEFILINLSCKLAYFLRYQEFGDYEDYYVSFFIIFNLAWIGASLFNNAYDTANLVSLKAFIRNLFTTLFVHLFIVFLYIVSMKAQYLSRLYMLYTYATALLALISFRATLILVYKYINSLSYYIRRIVMVGPEHAMEELYTFFDRRHTTVYRFLEQVDTRLSPEERETLMTETVEQIKTFCLRQPVHEIYVSLPLATEAVLEDLAGFADDHFIYFRLVTDFSALEQRRVSVDFVGHIPILALRPEPLKAMLNRILKRTFDILFSAGVIVFIFPLLFPVVALLIRLDSPGPIIFRQRRSGKNNRTFWLYKFRTMVVNAEADQRQARPGDVRVTRIGAFLRRTSLDEFPQFVNVLKGDMSVVGPRPHMLKHTDEYSRIIEKFLVRHFITPGITGLAQVNGYRGGTGDPELMRKRVEYDTRYIENWSLLLDLKIIIQTVWNLLRGQSQAY